MVCEVKCVIAWLTVILAGHLAQDRQQKEQTVSRNNNVHRNN